MYEVSNFSMLPGMRIEQLHPLQNRWKQQTKVDPIKNPTKTITIPKPPNCGGVKQYDQNKHTSLFSSMRSKIS